MKSIVILLLDTCTKKKYQSVFTLKRYFSLFFGIDNILTETRLFRVYCDSVNRHSSFSFSHEIDHLDKLLKLLANYKHLDKNKSPKCSSLKCHLNHFMLLSGPCIGFFFFILSNMRIQ